MSHLQSVLLVSCFFRLAEKIWALFEPRAKFLKDALSRKLLLDNFLNGHTVGGLTVYFVDECTDYICCWCCCKGLHGGESNKWFLWFWVARYIFEICHFDIFSHSNWFEPTNKNLKEPFVCEGGGHLRWVITYTKNMINQSINSALEKKIKNK